MSAHHPGPHAAALAQPTILQLRQRYRDLVVRVRGGRGGRVEEAKTILARIEAYCALSRAVDAVLADRRRRGDTSEWIP